MSEPRCDACTHLTGDHDALGLRYCAATMGAALSRGCICPQPSIPKARQYDVVTSDEPSA